MSISTPQPMYVRYSNSGSTCFEAEYLSKTHVLVRDSKLNWLTKRGVRALPVKDYNALLAGLQDGEFDYSQNYENYNGSNIHLKMDSGRFMGKYSEGITMDHESWSRGPLWFSRSEWDSFREGVKLGKFTLEKLQEDKIMNAGWRGFMRRIRSTFVQLRTN